MRFDGDTIYSYNTPIASFYKTPGGTVVVLVTSERYSVTTSGKHMPAVHRAVSHYTSFTVPNLGTGDQGRHRNPARAMHADNLAHYIVQYADGLKSLARAGDKAEWRISQLRDTAAEAKRYVETFDVSVDADYFAVNFPVPAPEELAAAKARASKAAAEKAKATFEKNKNARETANRAINEYLAGEVTVFPWQWERLATPEQLKAVGDMMLRLWREGSDRRDFVMGLGTLPVALRVKGDVIETSHGAEFPLADAVHAYRILNGYRKKGLRASLEGDFVIRVGSFHIDAIDLEGNVKAGCHAVQWPEIERLAKTLGLAA
jgi:hypothetical protein